MSAYGDTDDARAFWTARGYTIPVSWTDGQIDAARLVVSEWIDARYVAGFAGEKTGQRDQVREWPRAGSHDIHGWTFENDEFPRELLNAVYLATFYQMTTPGTFTASYTPPKYKRAAVDGAVSVEYMQFNYAYETLAQYPTIDQAIASIIARPGGNVSMLSGAVGRG